MELLRLLPFFVTLLLAGCALPMVEEQATVCSLVATEVGWPASVDGTPGLVMTTQVKEEASLVVELALAYGGVGSARLVVHGPDGPMGGLEGRHVEGTNQVAAATTLDFQAPSPGTWRVELESEGALLRPSYSVTMVTCR